MTPTHPAPPEQRIRLLLHDVLDAAVAGLKDANRPVPDRTFVSWFGQAADGVQLYTYFDRVQPQNPVGVRTVSTNDHLTGISIKLRLYRDWPVAKAGMSRGQAPAHRQIEVAADDLLVDVGAMLHGVERLVRSRGDLQWSDGQRQASISDGVPLNVGGTLVGIELSVLVGLA